MKRHLAAAAAAAGYFALAVSADAFDMAAAGLAPGVEPSLGSLSYPAPWPPPWPPGCRPPDCRPPPPCGVDAPCPHPLPRLSGLPGLGGPPSEGEWIPRERSYWRTERVFDPEASPAANLVPRWPIDMGDIDPWEGFALLGLWESGWLVSILPEIEYRAKTALFGRPPL